MMLSFIARPLLLSELYCQYSSVVLTRKTSLKFQVIHALILVTISPPIPGRLYANINARFNCLQELLSDLYDTSLNS